MTRARQQNPEDGQAERSGDLPQGRVPSAGREARVLDIHQPQSSIYAQEPHAIPTALLSIGAGELGVPPLESSRRFPRSSGSEGRSPDSTVDTSNSSRAHVGAFQPTSSVGSAMRAADHPAPLTTGLLAAATFATEIGGRSGGRPVQAEVLRSDGRRSEPVAPPMQSEPRPANRDSDREPAHGTTITPRESTRRPSSGVLSQDAPHLPPNRAPCAAPCPCECKCPQPVGHKPLRYVYGELRDDATGAPLCHVGIDVLLLRPGSNTYERIAAAATNATGQFAVHLPLAASDEAACHFGNGLAVFIKAHLNGQTVKLSPGQYWHALSDPVLGFNMAVQGGSKLLGEALKLGTSAAQVWRPVIAGLPKAKMVPPMSGSRPNFYDAVQGIMAGSKP